MPLNEPRCSVVAESPRHRCRTLREMLLGACVKPRLRHISSTKLTGSQSLRIGVSEHYQILDTLVAEIIPGMSAGLVEKPILAHGIFV